MTVTGEAPVVDAATPASRPTSTRRCCRTSRRRGSRTSTSSPSRRRCASTRCPTTRASSSSGRAATRTSSSTTASTSRRCRTAASGTSRAPTSCRRCRSRRSAPRPSSTASRAASSTSSPSRAATTTAACCSGYIIPGDWVGQQHAQRAVPLHRALQPAGHLRAGRPDQARPPVVLRHPPDVAPGHDRRRRRPEPRTRRRQELQAVRQADGAPVRDRQPRVGWNNNMFCCGATASRTAPLITQTVEHGHNPVSTASTPQTFGNATLLEVRGGGIYIRDNFTPYSDDFETPGRTDQSTGFSVNGQNASKQFHNRTTLDASLAHTTSGVWARARTTSRPASRRPMRRSAPSGTASAASATPISAARSTGRPSTSRRPPAAASGRSAPTCRTPGR